MDLGKTTNYNKQRFNTVMLRLKLINRSGCISANEVYNMRYRFEGLLLTPRINKLI